MTKGKQLAMRHSALEVCKGFLESLGFKAQGSLAVQEGPMGCGVVQDGML